MAYVTPLKSIFTLSVVSHRGYAEGFVPQMVCVTKSFSVLHSRSKMSFDLSQR